MTRTAHNRGSALLIAVVVTLLIAGFSAMYLTLVNARQLQSRATNDGRVAKSLAESAAASYVNYLNQSGAVIPTTTAVEWPDSGYSGAELDPTGTYYVLKHMSGGQFHCRVTPMANSKLLITGIGEYNGVLQTMNVMTTTQNPDPLPLAGDAGAINIFGFPGQNIDFNYNITTGSGVSGGTTHPALIIQDPDTMTAPDVVQFLADIENGVIDANKFDGGITAGYDANGDGVTTQISVLNNPNLSVNQDTMEAFRQSLVTAADSGTATAFGYSAGTPVVHLGSITQSTSTTLTLGSPANQQVTYIDGSVNIVDGTLKGSGTLVVRGDLTIGENVTTTTATTTAVTSTKTTTATTTSSTTTTTSKSGKTTTTTTFTTVTTVTTTNPSSTSTTTSKSSTGTVGTTTSTTSGTTFSTDTTVTTTNPATSSTTTTTSTSSSSKVGTTTTQTVTDGKLDWTGDIIVVGSTAGAGTSANFTINTPSTTSSTGNHSGGGLYVVSNTLGSNFNLVSGNTTLQNGTAAVALSSPTNNSALTITGGTMNVQGILVNMGGTVANLKTKADGSNSGGSLELNGSIFVGVRQDNGQVNVDLNDQMHIAYNQNFYENALTNINTLINAVGTNVTANYTIESYADNFQP